MTRFPLLDRWVTTRLWRVFALAVAFGTIAVHPGCAADDGNPAQPASIPSSALSSGAVSGSPSGTASGLTAETGNGDLGASGNSSDDVSSELASGDATSGNMADEAAPGASTEDAFVESTPGPSSGTSSDMATDAGNGCPNPLGTVWNETESDGSCATTWTRQGSTSTFTSAQVPPCHETATLTVVVSGTNVSAYWTTSSDGEDCNYFGTLSADCSTASGLFTCTGNDAASGTWKAAITP